MIYMMQAADDAIGPVKIGISLEPEIRLRNIQMYCPHRLRIVRSLDYEAWAEKWLHDHFWEYRLWGEWFRFEPTMLTIDPPKSGKKVRLTPLKANRMGRARTVAARVGETKTIALRLRPYEMEALVGHAVDRDIQFSTLARHIIKEWMEREGEPSTTRKVLL